MGYERMWSCIHVMWSVAYVACGAAHLVAGIFFILGIPSWILGCNLLTGSYNILMGIGVGMVACCGQVTPRRQETLLYMTVSILMANIANIVVTEYGFYHVHITKLMEEHQYNELIKYACFGTRGTAALILLISFVDSQLAFCSMQTAAVARNAAKKPPKNLYYHHHRGAPGALGVGAGSHEQVSDIEYIIPRQKSSTKSHHQQQQQVYNAYSQSWVFDADSNNTSTTLVSNPNGSGLGLGHSSSSQKTLLTSYHPHQQQPQQQPHLQYYDGGGGGYAHVDVVRSGKGPIGLNCALVVTDTNNHRYEITDSSNPAIHIVEEAAAAAATDTDRKLDYMRSFSRSASPSSSQVSLNNNNNNIKHQVVMMVRGATNENDDGVVVAVDDDKVTPHASLMRELQNALVSKTAAIKSSTSSSSVRSSKNSDAEFSKELEAALQLIQDLESPNTLDSTPSEHRRHRSSNSSSGTEEEEEDRTLSEQPVKGGGGETNGKGTTTTQCVFVVPLNGGGGGGGSQSTSGYSSPTRGATTNSNKINLHQQQQVWSSSSGGGSNASSMNSGSSQNLMLPLSYTIHNTKSTAVISLFTHHHHQDVNATATKPKSITLVNITGEDSCHDTHDILPIAEQHQQPQKEWKHHHTRTESSASSSTTSANGNSGGAVWSVRSLLRKKRATPPKLCPELEEAIVKSESLAYLSELELVARHERNASIQRQIEQKVHQQLSIPRTSSNC